MRRRRSFRGVLVAFVGVLVVPAAVAVAASASGGKIMVYVTQGSNSNKGQFLIVGAIGGLRHGDFGQ